MPDFPAAGLLADTDTVNQQAVDAQEAWLAATKQLPGAAPLSTLIIASGLVTPTAGIHRVDTEGAGPAGNLDRIATINLPNGSILILSSVDSSRVVTVRDNQGGAGSINLETSTFTMSSPFQRLFLQREGAGWRELFRIYGAGNPSGWRSFQGLNVSATYPIATNVQAVSADPEDALRLINPTGLLYALNHDFRMIGGKPAVAAVKQADEVLIRTNIGTELAPIWVLRKATVAQLVPQPFESGEFSTNTASNNSVAHNLGAVPSRVAGVMRCKVANNGYAIGNEVNVDAAYSSGDPRFISIWCSSTHVGYACYGDGAVPIAIVHRDGGAEFFADTTQWKLVLRAWR